MPRSRAGRTEAAPDAAVPVWAVRAPQVRSIPPVFGRAGTGGHVAVQDGDMAPIDDEPVGPGRRRPETPGHRGRPWSVPSRANAGVGGNRSAPRTSPGSNRSADEREQAGTTV
ncbi:hypothetical protein Acsp04_22300 [Actinomadura sp. NBRC 104425]|nr:hypothetical protein Acsp04_22300 [Actinomadura sp. NBRC 104425]